MKLATIENGAPDGALVVVSRDGAWFAPAAEIAPNMQAALEDWTGVEPALAALSAKVNAGAPGDRKRCRDVQFRAPLPRAWQWLDGSAFPSHGELMDRVFGITPVKSGKPLMYQGVSDQFYAPTEDVPFLREADGIDFEGEFGVIVDETPAGISPADAFAHIKLIVQINDWSLRMLGPAEMKTGFGWIQAKPPCSAAPFAVTPSELGQEWRDGRVCLDLLVDWNGKRFGAANGDAMEFGFHELVAHAAGTRRLCAGTIIGSGTVSNQNYREIGSSCIAERRGIELLDTGEAKTGFMRFGDRVRMEARGDDVGAPFGVIDQQVVSQKEAS